MDVKPVQKAVISLWTSNQKTTTVMDTLSGHAETAFYSSKIQASTSCKELFHNINTICSKKNSTPLLSSFGSDDIPQVHCEYFENRILTITNSFLQLVQQFLWMKLLTPANSYTNHWTICFKHSPNDCLRIMWYWSHYHRIAVWKPWCSSHNDNQCISNLIVRYYSYSIPRSPLSPLCTHLHTQEHINTFTYTGTHTHNLTTPHFTHPLPVSPHPHPHTPNNHWSVKQIQTNSGTVFIACERVKVAQSRLKKRKKKKREVLNSERERAAVSDVRRKVIPDKWSLNREWLVIKAIKFLTHNFLLLLSELEWRVQ